jgi:hypothetical protein
LRIGVESWRVEGPLALVARRYNTDIVLLRQGLGGPLSLRPSSYSPGLIIRKRVKGDAERKLGKSPVTANLAHKTVAAALGAAVKVGYIL